MKKFVFFLILIAIILTAEIEEELQGPLMFVFYKTIFLLQNNYD